MSDQGTVSDEWGYEHLRQAVKAARVALWSWNVDTDQFRMDKQAFELWGLPWSERVSFEELSAHIHPADRNRVRAGFMATRLLHGSYEIDFRIRLGDDIRWISARGLGADDGIVDHVTFGVFQDVTRRKQAEESHELLAGEMSHRVKNLLAIAGALTQITSRSAKTVREMASQLTGRLTALGRAHDLVRPLPGHDGKAALLGDLLSVLLAPYGDSGASTPRIHVAVPRMGVGERSATALALVIHELATNAVKHGALSSPEGLVDITSTIDGDDVFVVWTETGGPVLDHAAEMRGFGSQLVSRSVSDQLGGELSYDWQQSGVVVTLRLQKDRLAD